jgi:hypothetical protein
VALGADAPRHPQDAEVLAHGGAPHRELVGDHPDGLPPAGQELEHGTPGRVPEGVERCSVSSHER